MTQEGKSDFAQRMLASLDLEVEERPWRIRSIDAAFVSRIQALTAGVDVDLDRPLPLEPGDMGMP